MPSRGSGTRPGTVYDGRAVTEPLSTLRDELAQIVDLGVAARVLEWDQLVMMPRGGAETRAEGLATLHRLAHELFVRDEIGELLDRLEPEVADLDPDSDDACLVAVTRRDWEKARRVPPALQGEMTKLGSEAMEAWAEARANDDYASFRPWLDRTLELKQRYIECFPATDDPYDVLLDDFEPGMQTHEVRRVFERLEPALRELTAAAADEEPEPFLSGPYPREAQHALSLEVARAFGAADEHFRLDPTVHPFCLSFATRDIRLTTRYAEDDLHGNSLFSTMHEVGHGLYEHGGDAALDRTPLATGCSSALHESQSRLWENVIGRSLPFWRWFYPRFRDAFGDALADVPLERFHRAVNRPRPSFIRVDADETTYGLHIILRFQLEQELLFGGLSTADVPEAWNTRMEELVGVRPPNDRVGCLQDVHWSGGMFGYFPTYQLGNVLSAQIWERLVSDLPDAYERVERGSFGEIYEWLREHLYRHGRKFTPAAMTERLVGGPIDPEPYLRYLADKNASLAAA
jgi:carboxypeptidase Taq